MCKTARVSIGAFLAAGVTVATFALAVTMAPPRSSGKATVAPERPRNWPMFGGNPGRNLVNPFEKGLPFQWGGELTPERNIKWVAELGARAFGSAVVADGKIFIGTNNRRPRNPRDVDAKGRPFDMGVMMCFREFDGKFLWQAVHEKLPAGAVNDWPYQGIPSMPVVEGKRLYYVSNRCELICADTEGFLDGKNDGVQDEKRTGREDADIIWRLDMMKELGVFPHNLAVCSPLIVGDVVFVVTANGVDETHIDIPAPEAPSFVAVHKKTGKVAWKDNSPTANVMNIKGEGRQRTDAIRKLMKRGQTVMHSQWSNPTYAEAAGQGQVIFPGGDGWLRAFEPKSGKLLWKFDANPKASIRELGGKGTRSEFIATPVVDKGRLYIGVGEDPEHELGVGHLWCIDLARAVEKGRTNKDRDVSPVEDNFDPAAAINRHSALAWHFGGTTPEAEKKKTGQSFIFNRTMSTCAVHDGLCYAADLGGHLYCLDAETGRLYWKHDTESPIWSSPFWVDGKVYLGVDSKEVFVFAHGKEKKLLAKNEMDARLRAVPVAVNGVLYIATENKLYAIHAKR